MSLNFQLTGVIGIISAFVIGRTGDQSVVMKVVGGVFEIMGGASLFSSFFKVRDPVVIFGTLCLTGRIGWVFYNIADDLGNVSLFSVDPSSSPFNPRLSFTTSLITDICLLFLRSLFLTMLWRNFLVYFFVTKAGMHNSELLSSSDSSSITSSSSALSSAIGINVKEEGDDDILI